MRVFVCAHNSAPTLKAPYLAPVLAGAALGRTMPDGYLRDDTGENISDRNRSWCEQTVHYWIWKNTTDRVVGLCHYRRYFLPDADDKFRNDMDPAVAQKMIDSDIFGSRFLNLLEKAEIIVPKPKHFAWSIHQYYLTYHRAEDWAALYKAMRALYPGECEDAFRYFRSEKDLCEYNMFIGRRAAVDSYYEWSFPLLFEVERLITPSTDPYQARVMGFMAERLFSWWLHSRAPTRATASIGLIAAAQPGESTSVLQRKAGRYFAKARKGVLKTKSMVEAAFRIRREDRQWTRLINS